MYIPTIRCKIYKVGKRNAYNEVEYMPAINTMVAVVKLDNESVKTTVRSDVGGSKSHAEELESRSIILFKPKENISINDKIEVSGYTLEVKSIHKRFDIFGKLDHLESSCEIL